MNKFNRGPKLKLKIIRGTKNTILLIFLMRNLRLRYTFEMAQLAAGTPYSYVNYLNQLLDTGTNFEMQCCEMHIN